VAESYRGTDDGTTTSTLAGAVVRVDRTVDDFVFATCTVGGTDATDAVIDCWRRLDREDVRYLLLSGVAPAWYNVVDVERVASAVDRPVLAVSYEESEGLSDAIRHAFGPSAREARLATYETLPRRRRVDGTGETGRSSSALPASTTARPTGSSRRSPTSAARNRCGSHSGPPVGSMPSGGVNSARAHRPV